MLGDSARFAFGNVRLAILVFLTLPIALVGGLLATYVSDKVISLGSLVDEPTIRPTHHIFVGSKAPWFTITDDLPQYEGHMVKSFHDVP